MKSITLKLTILFLFTTALLAGCTKDNTTPESTDVRTAFLGKWSVSETWTKLSYEVTITTDPNSTDGVFISNFADTGTSGIPAGAVVSGNSITLDPDQVIGEGLKINGSGTLSGSKISWNYTLDNGATLIQAIATYTKQ
ncbi:MAG: hypothetical protein WCR01_08440 [Bacteroidota bacterium]